MKVVNKTVDMIAIFDREGNIKPWRFQIVENDSTITVDVQTVMDRKTDKIVGKEFIIFKCQSVINKMLKVYELRFNKEKFTWVLYEI